MPGKPNRIRELRGLRGLTVDQVAHRMGVVRDTVYRWERGDTGMNWEQMDRLAAILDTNVVWMMALDGNGNGNDDERVAA